MLSLTGQAEINRFQMVDYLKAVTNNKNSDLELIIGVYYDYAPLLGLRPDVAVCQMIVETSEKDPETFKWIPLTSWWSQVPRRNFAGIGVTGRTSDASIRPSIFWNWDDRVKAWSEGLEFPNLTTAVLAHLVHLHMYASGLAPDSLAQAVNPRTMSSWKTRQAAKLFQARTTEDLAGTWAADKTYGVKIEAKVNEIKKWKAGK